MSSSYHNGRAIQWWADRVVGVLIAIGYFFYDFTVHRHKDTTK